MIRRKINNLALLLLVRTLSLTLFSASVAARSTIRVVREAPFQTNRGLSRGTRIPPMWKPMCSLPSPGSMVLGTQSGQLGTPDFPNGFFTEHPSSSLDLYFYIVPDVALEMTSPALAGYDLASNLGPISVDSVVNPNFRTGGLYWDTTFGLVTFDSVSNVEFYSTVTTETPEPAGLGLTAGGLLLLAGTVMGRRIHWRLKSA